MTSFADDSNRARPHWHALTVAISYGASSPCRKSRRGVGAFSVKQTSVFDKTIYVHGGAHNRLPLAECDGSPKCRQLCGRRCVHAEAAAMLRLPPHVRGVQLVHVKVIESLPAEWISAGNGDADLDACVEPSGLPSCMQCAVLIAADPRVDAIWLMHRDGLVTSTGEQLPAGWRRWDAAEFYAETEAQVLR